MLRTERCVLAELMAGLCLVLDLHNPLRRAAGL